MSFNLTMFICHDFMSCVLKCVNDLQPRVTLSMLNVAWLSVVCNVMLPEFKPATYGFVVESFIHLPRRRYVVSFKSFQGKWKIFLFKVYNIYALYSQEKWISLWDYVHLFTFLDTKTIFTHLVKQVNFFQYLVIETNNTGT